MDGCLFVSARDLDLLMNLTDKQRESFFARIRRDDETGCWLWTGKPDEKGYGRFLTNHRAHRVAYVIFNGEIPAGLVVSQTCGIRLCVNPEHLEAAVQTFPDRGRKDGFEDEYGPIPPRVPDRDWFDEVAVDNLIFGGPSRPLTPREKESFIQRTRAWEVQDVATRLGSTVEQATATRNYYLIEKAARAERKAAA